MLRIIIYPVLHHKTVYHDHQHTHICTNCNVFNKHQEPPLTVKEFSTVASLNSPPERILREASSSTTHTNMPATILLTCQSICTKIKNVLVYNAPGAAFFLFAWLFFCAVFLQYDFVYSVVGYLLFLFCVD